MMREYDITENGKVYHVKEYPNGMVIKELKDASPEDHIPVTEQLLTELLMATEYQNSLMELQMEVV